MSVNVGIAGKEMLRQAPTDLPDCNEAGIDHGALHDGMQISEAIGP